MSSHLCRQNLIVLALAVMLSTATLLPAAERKVDARSEFKPKAPVARSAPAAATTPTSDQKSQPAERTAASARENVTATTVTPSVPAATAAAIVNPNAGEKLNWMVFSGAAGSASNGSFKLDVTVGQTASGRTSGGGFKLTQGFLQDFGSGSCCTGTTGNVNMTGIVDLGDLSALVSYLTGGGYVLSCVPEANVNNTGIVDLGDLSAMVSYLTGGGYVLPNCP